jgi:hypothetical protein
LVGAGLTHRLPSINSIPELGDNCRALATDILLNCEQAN